MIHQHFKLVDVLTAAENIVLGLEGKTVLKRREINRKVAELAQNMALILIRQRKFTICRFLKNKRWKY